MHTNRNKKAVKKVSRGMLKANKARNLFAVFAIILTTFMITSVFSLGISYKENYDTLVIRDAGTAATISLPNATEQQYEQIKSLDYLEAVGKQFYIGNLVKAQDNGNGSDVYVMSYDKEEWEKHLTPAVSDIHGSYPAGADEIMVSEDVLKQLGVDAPAIGQSIELDFESSSGVHSGRYSLSGWFKGYAANVKNLILFSEEYCVENGITLRDSGMVSISAKDSEEAYDMLEEDVRLNDGQEFQSYFGISDISDTIMMIALIIMMVLFIMASGILLIYNVFYISVSREINRYGMLKTIGTSQKQIRRIIIAQAMRLAYIGVPIGLALSAVFSLIIVPFALNLVNGDFDRISFSPVIFAGAAAFSLATVLISAWKPARIAGRISPVEALRYNSSSAGGKGRKRIKRGSGSSNGAKLYKMAWRNIFRNRKQTILVVISLFLGCMTMLSVNGFFGSINAESYESRYVKHDFVFINEPPMEDEFSDELLSQLKAIDGVKSFETAEMAFINIDFDEDALEPILRNAAESYGGDYSQEDYDNFVETMRGVAEQGQYGAWISTLDEKYVESYNEKHDKKIDVKAFKDGKTVIALGDNDLNGSKLTFVSGEGRRVVAEIGGAMDYEDVDYVSSVSMVVGMPGMIMVSDNFVKQLDCDTCISTVTFDADEELEPQVKSQVEELCDEYLAGATYELDVRADILKDFEESMMGLNIIGSSISLFLLVIGMLNFINLMMTSIYSRRREFAVMQATGATNRQIRKLLSFEGLYYAVITTVLVMLLGNGILLAEANMIPSVVDYAVFRYPVIPLTVLLGCIYILCLFIPFIVYRYSSRATITERLRDIEN